MQKLNEKEQALISMKQELERKLTEKEQTITLLQQENKRLSQEKYNLMSRLETARDRPDTDLEGLSLRVSDTVEMWIQSDFVVVSL